jgi:hypothetical protein
MATPLPETSAPLEVVHGQALGVLSGLPTGSVVVVLFDLRAAAPAGSPAGGS